jgi:proteasome lid subunit RPN8/RPN11
MENNIDQITSSHIIHCPSRNLLVISKNDLDKVVAHAIEARPCEACGLLAGRQNRVERVFRMRNTDASEISYCFDAGEQIKVVRKMDKAGMQMIAIYHSHPASPAFPSQVDIERAFFPGTRELSYPDTAHLILGLAAEEPEVRAFTITREGVREIKVIIENS